jgi:hypothetical protein
VIIVKRVGNADRPFDDTAAAVQKQCEFFLNGQTRGPACYCNLDDINDGVGTDRTDHHWPENSPDWVGDRRCRFA